MATPASAHGAVSWLEAFRIFESQTWEVWETRVLTPSPGSLPPGAERTSSPRTTPTVPVAPRVLRGGDAVQELGPLLSVSLEAAIPAKSLWKRLCVYPAGMLVGLPTSVSLCMCQSRAWSWLQKVGVLNLLQKTRLLCSRLHRRWKQGWKCSFPEALSKEHEQPVAGPFVDVKQGEEQPAAAWHTHEVWDGRRRASVLGLAPIDSPRLATFG